MEVDIPLMIKQAQVKEHMVGDKTLTALPENFYEICTEWLKTNKDKRMLGIFLNIQRTRLNLILKHIDQETLPFIQKMTEQEKNLHKILYSVVKEHDEKTTGDLKDV